MHRLQPMHSQGVTFTNSKLYHDINYIVYLSRADVGVQAVRRYGSRRIRYRAIYVRIGNLVVCSIDRT
jgi:hypothetical protein